MVHRKLDSQMPTFTGLSHVARRGGVTADKITICHLISHAVPCPSGNDEADTLAKVCWLEKALEK